jgi:hypothetical protein
MGTLKTTNKKGEQHEKANEHQPHYPIHPRIGMGLGPGYLVSSAIAIRRTCGGNKHDRGANDGTLSGHEGYERKNEGGNEGTGR